MKGKKKEKPFLWSENFSFLTNNVRNYNKIAPKKQEKNTLFQIMGDISHLFGNEIPYPQSHYFSNNHNKMVYCWYIDGYFKTQKNVQFINDIIARFKLTTDCQLHSFKAMTIENINPISLKSFKGLKSLARDKLKEKYQRVETRADDYVFWCLKLYAEDLIRQDGLIVWNSFEKWAFDNFLDLAKDKSTLKAKCRNIFNWYFERDWKVGRTISKNKEDVLEYRRELARNLAAKKEEENYNKVENAITGLLADSMFRKKNGKWNAVAIAEYLNLDPRTVRKYLPKD